MQNRKNTVWNLVYYLLSVHAIKCFFYSTYCTIISSGSSSYKPCASRRRKPWNHNKKIWNSKLKGFRLKHSLQILPYFSPITVKTETPANKISHSLSKKKTPTRINFERLTQKNGINNTSVNKIMTANFISDLTSMSMCNICMQGGNHILENEKHVFSPWSNNLKNVAVSKRLWIFLEKVAKDRVDPFCLSTLEIGKTPKITLKI